jgi:hypothetical protein
MRLDAKSGVRGLLIDVDANRPVRWVRWADIPEDPNQPGEYEAFRSDPEEARRQGVQLSALVYRGRCRLRFVPAAPRLSGKPTSPRDMIASLDDARRRLVQPKLLIPGELCQERGCHRLASWKCSDEVEIEPERDADGRQHERAVTVRVHSWCDAHFCLPVFQSVRGVEQEVSVEVRPQ